MTATRLRSNWTWMFQDLVPDSPKFSKDFDRKAFSNVLGLFDIILFIIAKPLRKSILVLF